MDENTKLLLSASVALGSSILTWRILRNNKNVNESNLNRGLNKIKLLGDNIKKIVEDYRLKKEESEKKLLQKTKEIQDKIVRTKKKLVKEMNTIDQNQQKIVTNNVCIGKENKEMKSLNAQINQKKKEIFGQENEIKNLLKQINSIKNVLSENNSLVRGLQKETFMKKKYIEQIKYNTLNINKKLTEYDNNRTKYDESILLLQNEMKQTKIDNIKYKNDLDESLKDILDLTVNTIEETDHSIKKVVNQLIPQL